MRGLRRFLDLPNSQRLLMFQALVILFAIRLALRYVSLPTIQRLASGMCWRQGKTLGVDQIVRAIRSARHFVPGATCLVQALTAQALLIRHAHDARLKIGVMKDSAKGFGAHAWVTCGQHVVFGGRHTENYAILMGLP